MTVPYAAVDEGASVETDSAVGDAWRASVGWIVGEIAGEAALGCVDSDDGTHPAKMELAAIKLPVTEAISFKASWRDNLPSS